MSNVLNEEKQQQIIVLGRLGWSLRRIEQQTGVRRETASAYLKAAGIAVRGPGRWGRGTPTPTHVPPTDSTAAKPANEVITDSGEKTPENSPPDASNPSPTASACEPYRETIELWLDRGRNAMAIWQDLVDQHGYSGGYQTVNRFVRKLRGAHSPQAVGIILTAPGEEAQVDYGTGPMVRDEKSGKYRRTRLFVMTLGYSRKSVRLLVFRSSSQTWAELHEKAFRRLGGSPRVVVLDNLREGVLTADLYDPTLNPLYRDVLSHYGVVAMPCRVRDPDRKGKVESGVGHAQKTPLKGQRFESLEEAQAYLDHWEKRWADTRIHGTTKRPSGRHVRRGKAVLTDVADRTVSLLPVRRAGGPSRRLRRSRAGLLRLAAGLDRPAGQSPMGCSSCPHPRSQKLSALARAPAPVPWQLPHQR